MISEYGRYFIPDEISSSRPIPNRFSLQMGQFDTDSPVDALHGLVNVICQIAKDQLAQWQIIVNAR